MTLSPWKFGDDTGTQLVSDVWNIRTTIKYQNIIDSLPSFYEALIERYTTVFGELPYPKDRLDVFLFANETQWRQKLQQMLGAEAEHWYQLGRGGLTIDGVGVLYHIDRRGRSRATFRIAAHEGWHEYAESVFVKCLPTWLDEGIGTWMEGFRFRNGTVQFIPSNNWDRLPSMRKIASAKRFTPLKELLSSDPSTLLETSRSSLLGYYAQLWAFTSYLVENHPLVLNGMLQDAVSGNLTVPRGGWLYAFTDNPVQLEKEYQDWVIEYVKRGTSWR